MKTKKRQTVVISAGNEILTRFHDRACAIKFAQGRGADAELSVVIDPDEVWGRVAWLVFVAGVERFASFRRSEAVEYAARHGELATVCKGRMFLASNKRIKQPIPAVEGGAEC